VRNVRAASGGALVSDIRGDGLPEVGNSSRDEEKPAKLAKKASLVRPEVGCKG